MIAMPKAKNHVVPEFLLKRFKGEAGDFYYYNKEKGGPVEHRNTKNVFYKRRYYVTRSENGSTDTSLEDFYSELETVAKPLFDWIEIHLERRLVPKLKQESRSFLNIFMATQFKRVPDRIEKLDYFKNPLPELRKLVEDGIERGDIPASSREELEKWSEEKVQQVMNQARVDSLRLYSAKVLRALEYKHVCWAIAKSGSGFIIGSNPVVRDLYSLTSNLRSQNVIIWLPLSSKSLIGFCGYRKANLIFEFDEKHCDLINRDMFEQSSQVAAPTSALLENLLVEEKAA